MAADLPLRMTAILGTIDEAENLRRLLPRLRPVVRQIVVVDDGSTDGSREVAASHGAEVVARPRRLGIGSAVYAGFAVAAEPLVATMDADGSHPPEDLPRAHREILAGADVVKFSRFLSGSRWDAPWARRLLLRTYGILFDAVCGFRLSDPTNGFLVARRDCFEGDTVFGADPGEGWVAEFLDRNRGRRIAEVSYEHAARGTGRSHFGLRRETQRAWRSLALGRGPGRSRTSPPVDPVEDRRA